MRPIKYSMLLLLGILASINAFPQDEEVAVVAIPDSVSVYSNLPEGEVEGIVAQKDTIITESKIIHNEDSVVTKPDTAKVKAEVVETILAPVKPDTIPAEITSIEYEQVAAKTDTVVIEPIVFTPASASEYIGNLIDRKDLWRKSDESMRLSLKRLIDHFNEPFESVNNRLLQFPYESVKYKQYEVSQNDTLPLRWLNKSMFIIDTVALEKEPFILQRTIVKQVIDQSSLQLLEFMPDMKERIESILQPKDTIVEKVVDYTYLQSKNIRVYEYTEKGITPTITPRGNYRSPRFIADSTKLVIPKIKKGLIAQDDSPFLFIPSEKMTDSLKVAVKTLSSYTSKRDSIKLNINDLVGRTTPLWLSSGRDDLHRYWVKNSKNDSITIWIGNPSKYDLVLVLEDEVSVERFEKRLIDDIPFTTAIPDRSLAKLRPLKEIPVFWDYGLASSYSLNQNYLSNWARGGESSLASLLDVNAKANYNNKEAKTRWSNSGRIRYATTRTKEQGFRTNTDILEINSQFNKVMREKIDFSSVLYFKTQVAKGYSYPANDPRVLRSKFLNPGAITIGVGMEYKPNKKTTINFAPLSYRNTFVLDTISINQTTHGIEKDKRSRQEMGGQLVARNSMTILKDMEITNTIRLFSSYLEKPQNVDVDWEMGIEKQISWYFKVRLNLHLIYDDNVKFPVVDKNNQPVLLPDGTQRKAAKPQFNQFLGLTLAFKI